MPLVQILLEEMPNNATSLSIIGSPVTVQDAPFIAKKINAMPALQELVLQDCGLTSDAIEIIAPALVTHQRIMRVNFSNNPISNLTGVFILLENKHIYDIDISHCRADMTKHTAQKFLSYITSSPHITDVGLPYNIERTIFSKDEAHQFLHAFSKRQTLLSCFFTEAFGRETIANTCKINTENARNLIRALLTGQSDSVSYLFTMLPAVLSIARKTSQQQEIIEQIEKQNLRSQALMANIDVSFFDFIKAAIEIEATPIEIQDTKIEDQFDDGLSQGFTPLRSRYFEKSLVLASFDLGITCVNDFLTEAALKNNGKLTGLHLLAKTLKENRGITLQADHFCQMKGILGTEHGNAYFSYFAKEPEGLKTLLQFVLLSGTPFSAKALVNKDKEDQTLLSLCSKHALLNTLFEPSLWKNALPALEELLKHPTLTSPQKHYINRALRALDGRAIPEPPPRVYSHTFSDEFVNIFTQVDISYNLNSTHPLATIAEGNRSAIDIALLSELTTTAAGYPLEADDMFRLLPPRQFNVLSFKDSKKMIPSLMAFFAKTGSKFTRDSFNIINDDGNTPLKALHIHNALSDFFIPDYWQNDPLLLAYLAENETGPIRQAINTCINQLNKRGLVIHVKKEERKKLRDIDDPFFSPTFDGEISRGINDFTRRYFNGAQNNLLCIAVNTNSIVLFLKLNAYMQEQYGVKLVANDFCRIDHKGDTATQLIDTNLIALPIYMAYLKHEKSMFDIEALFYKQRKTSFLDNVYAAKQETTFFDPDYWSLSPETLRMIAKRDLRFKDLVEETLKKISSSQEAGQDKPQSAAEDSSTEQNDASSGLNKLKDAADTVVLPTLRALHNYLAANAGNQLGLWRYGEDIIRIRQEFAFVAMEVTTAGTMQNGSTAQTLQFLHDFSKARTILDEYADQPKEKQPTTAFKPADNSGKFFSRLFNWKMFGNEETQKIIDLGEAIRLTKQAGKTLQMIVPGLDHAGHMAARKMAMLDTIVQTNDKIISILDRHIDVGNAFLNGEILCDAPPAPKSEDSTEPQQDEAQTALPIAIIDGIETPSVSLNEVSAARLHKRISLLEEIKATVVSENAAKKITADLYCRQASTLDLQSGATMANLATQVSSLHGTLDLLQASASSQSLAEATTQANGQQVADLVLTAQKSMTAIEATVKSVQASVISLENVSASIEQAPSLSKPVSQTGLTSTQTEEPDGAIVEIPLSAIDGKKENAVRPATPFNAHQAISQAHKKPRT